MLYGHPCQRLAQLPFIYSTRARRLLSSPVRHRLALHFPRRLQLADSADFKEPGKFRPIQPSLRLLERTPRIIHPGRRLYFSTVINGAILLLFRFPPRPLPAPSAPYLQLPALPI